MKDKIIEIINNGLHDTQCMSCEDSFDTHRNNIIEAIEALDFTNECERCKKLEIKLTNGKRLLKNNFEKICKACGAEPCTKTSLDCDVLYFIEKED